jgi:Protein of unknown function (DUF559)
MSDHLRSLAARQEDVVCSWQLRGLGWSVGKVRHHLRRAGWRRLHPGVYLLTNSAPTRRQLWVAAVLTAPGTVLSHGSAGACYGFYRFERGYEVVTRPGNAGRRRHGRLLVFHSTILNGNITRHQRIPITTAARVLIDLAPGFDDQRLGRIFRESIRLKATTARKIVHTIHRHKGRPGTRRLLSLAARYSGLPYDRTRSDAEALALEILHDAGVPPPLVNVRIAGEEADLVWPERTLIIEIDGPQFHLFRAEDERKQAIWEAAGYTVRRIPSDAVYKAPLELVNLYWREDAV